MRRSRLVTVAAGLAAGSLMLAACGDDGGDDETATDDGGEETSDDSAESDEGDDSGAGAVEAQMISEADTANCDPAANDAPMPDPEGTGEDETTISIGKFPGWDENEVVIELAKLALEEQGYTVEVTELDVGANYTGVADGELDMMMDAWLPGTHGALYVDMDADGAQLGDSLEDLGCWFDQGFLTIAVNADSPAQSLAELADFSEEYGNRIVGIDPGAGLTTVTRENVIPTYGLESWDFPESSGTAMLAELDSAMSAGENIVVTLWHPHWAYAAYDIRDLEDPEGTLGGAERLYNLGRPGFHEDFPNAAQLMKNLYLSDAQLLDLEDRLVLEYEREDNAQAVQDWLAENPDFMENWRAGELS